MRALKTGLLVGIFFAQFVTWAHQGWTQTSPLQSRIPKPDPRSTTQYRMGRIGRILGWLFDLKASRSSESLQRGELSLPSQFPTNWSTFPIRHGRMA